MATLHVENVPDELYEAIRERARRKQTSIAAEVLALLQENIPSKDKLARREILIERATRLRSRQSPASGPFPGSEEMLREDRSR